MKNLKLIWLILLMTFGVGSALAQTKPSQCENFGKKDFQGENITINVEKTDIRDILKTFSEKYGCKFVMDKSVTKIPLDVTVSEVPWNILLDAILKAGDLDIQINSSSLRVTKTAVRGCSEIPNNRNDKEPLFTEFIRLNYLQAGSYPGPCGFGCSPDDLRKQPTGLSKVIAKLLSRRGAIETDSRSNSLIITDTKEKVMSIRKQIADWDKPETNLDEIIKNFESKIQL